MRTAPMCFSILRVPRSSVYSLVNTWWKGFDAISPECKRGYGFRLLSASVGGHERKSKSKSWSRRPITTTVEGRSKNSLSSSAANARQDLSDKVIVTANITTIRTDDGDYQQVQYADVRQQIVENKDLASLATFIVFDLETTGLSRTERIIEIALQDLHGGENSTFHTLVNPGCFVPNTRVHGISTTMVRKPGVPRMKELIPILLQFVQSRLKPGGYVVLVAHNARSFDVPFLVNEFERYAYEIPSNWYFVDTLPLGREAMKSAGLTKTSLQALREYYGIQLQGSAHRAMSDVHSLSLVLQRLTFDLKLPIDGLVQKAFKANEIVTNSNGKKKKYSS